MDSAPHLTVQQNRLLLQASRLARLGAWECDLETDELTWTDGVYDLFELPQGHVPKRRAIVDLYDEISRLEMEEARASVIQTGRATEIDVRIRTIRGENRWMRLSIGVAHEHGRPTRLYGAKQNITAEKMAWESLRRRADCDALTGLANRAVFDARYRDVVGNNVNNADVSALALIDLDHFKRINDSLGHAAGDECLRETGRRLQHFFTGADLIARVGGDEFALLFRAPLDRSRIVRILGRVLPELCRPIFSGRHRLVPSVSIGAALLGGPRAGRPSDLFAHADAALYAAKAAGRHTFRVFGADHHAFGPGEFAAPA